MAVVIPELELVVILENFMKGIKADYDARAVKTESILGQMFSGLTFGNGKYDLYTQAVSLFIDRQDTTADTPDRVVTIRSYYDRKSIKTPTMHIAAPSEEERDNWIGGGFTGQHSGIDGGFDATYEQRVRRYQSRHAIIFTSDNWIEVQLMYFLIKHGITSIFDSLILRTFQDPHLSGHELKMNDTAGSEHFYSRSLIITSANESCVPNFHTTTHFNEIVFPQPILDPDPDIKEVTIIINPLN